MASHGGLLVEALAAQRAGVWLGARVDAEVLLEVVLAVVAREQFAALAAHRRAASSTARLY